jgi:hypothetical protein
MHHHARLCAIASGLALSLTLSVAHAAPVIFSAQLAVVDRDNGEAIYTGVPTGTDFNGEIDDETFAGFITDGTTRTDFGCCISAPGLTLINDHVISAAEAAQLNALLGSAEFEEGELADLAGLAGDTVTDRGGRFELSLRYILDPDAFDDEDPSNYPFDNADVTAALVFLFEDNDDGEEIYSGYGLASAPVPLPAAAWLFLTAFGAVLRPGRLLRRLRRN